MSSVRAKFKCTHKEPNPRDKDEFLLTFDPVTGGSPENDQFFKYTPSGQLRLGTVNRAAADQLHVGLEYYLDLTPAPAPAAAPVPTG
jgi:hypothetical protein